MKAGIHPNYKKVVFQDTSTGFKFLTGSTKGSAETIEWEDGNTYPLLKVEISADSTHSTQASRSLLMLVDVLISLRRSTR